MHLAASYTDRATLRDVALPGAQLRPRAGSGPRGERDRADSELAYPLTFVSPLAP